MRIFIYKTIFIIFCLVIFYKLTIDNTINNLETKLNSIKSKENIEKFTNKIRKELTNGLNKERILSEEDARLINKILKKITSEINQSN